jgi:transcriptional regulator with XRE-family HTH domain
MADEFDIVKLSAMIRKKRGERGLREVAQEIGEINASTLSRIEHGNLPDLATFLRICRWLSVSPDEFTPAPNGRSTATRRDAPPTLDAADMITAHLRADRTLDPKTVEALSTMIRLAFEDANRRAHEQHEPEPEQG